MAIVMTHVGLKRAIKPLLGCDTLGGGEHLWVLLGEVAGAGGVQSGVVGVLRACGAALSLAASWQGDEEAAAPPAHGPQARPADEASRAGCRWTGRHGTAATGLTGAVGPARGAAQPAPRRASWTPGPPATPRAGCPQPSPDHRAAAPWPRALPARGQACQCPAAAPCPLLWALSPSRALSLGSSPCLGTRPLSPRHRGPGAAPAAHCPTGSRASPWPQLSPICSPPALPSSSTDASSSAAQLRGSPHATPTLIPTAWTPARVCSCSCSILQPGPAWGACAWATHSGASPYGCSATSGWP